MGCCFFACIGAIWPRLVLFFVWLLTGIPGKVFQTWYWPLLGFFFLPTTTLAYELCRFYGHLDHIEDAVWAMVVVFVAFLHDLGQLGVFRQPRDQGPG